MVRLTNKNNDNNTYGTFIKFSQRQ